MKSVSQGLPQRTMIYGLIQARQRQAKPVYPSKLSALLDPIVIVLYNVFYTINSRAAYCPGSSVGRAAD